jgi:hypothetical protein
MKQHLLLLFLASSFASAAPDFYDGREWIHRPSGKFTWEDWTKLPETDIYEVVATKETAALIRELADKKFVLITENTAKYYTGHYYRCPPGKKPYIVRAVYGQGGTGNYAVFKRGDELLVHHASLGSTTATHKSALIINLDFKAASSYTFLELAE